MDSKNYYSLPYLDELEGDKSSNSLENSDNKEKISMMNKKSISESVHYDDDPSITKLNIEIEETQSRGAETLKNHRSLLPELLSKKAKRTKSEITVCFFNTSKKITFSKA